MSLHTSPLPCRTASCVRAEFTRLAANASLLALMALAACGGGADKSPTEPGTPPPVTPPVGADPGVPLTGTASLAATGLPTGGAGRVLIKSGASEHVLSGAAAVAGLAPGEWTATAEPVTVDGITYVPTPLSQTFTVAAAAVVVVRVTYIRVTGLLQVTVSGLPAGAAGDVVVTGPDAFRRVIEGSASVLLLPPGRYRVEAHSVKLAAGRFAPVVLQQDIDVLSSPSAVVEVAYVVAPSIVVVDITGLPGGSAASVTLTPPTGADIAVPASLRLPAAAAGRWQLKVQPVRFVGFTWTGTPASRDTSVAAGDSLVFEARYALSTGAMAVAIAGLPSGAGALVRVSGPGGFERVINATTTLTDLAPGLYTVTADSVVGGDATYRSSTATQLVSVSASLTAAGVSVTYSAAVATLTVGLSGVPVGATNMVQVTGPGGFDRFISGTTTFARVTPGVYTVVASPVILPGGLRYEATPAIITRTLIFGANDSVGVTYARAGGKAMITVVGLPAGAASSVTLSGNGVVTAISGSMLFDNLAPGVYTLSALPVRVGVATYDPTPSTASLSVTSGNTSNATVTYTSNVMPPVGSGGVNLVLDGFYLTQAIQRPDGSVPLVAGRDALLRVFVHASEANTVQPSVRVRVYDGATLLQTLSLNAPEGAVRTALAEGTLTSTWNSVIAGANVRPSLRIVADVDPTGAVPESDESDNGWPRSGVPLVVAVNTVPTFNVRFVPVTVAGLTGNVTPANKEQFLASTRRMHPVNDITSDVRAPFTSSAPPLQASDGNSAWITVLSELNALRAADGAPSTTHYYGVVKTAYSSGIAGFGYVPGRAAMGWDYLPSGDAVAVHEWGHNFGRPHTNCGGADNPDATYPYPGGITGQWGWNSSTGTLVSPTATDVMGYCSNQWTSDWTWSRVMSARGTSGLMAAAAQSGATQDGLLVWGRIVNGKVILEPAFRVRSRPTPVSSDGWHRLQGLDARGNTVLDIQLATQQVDHAFNRTEEHFAVVVAWSSAMERTLATLRVLDVRQPLAVGSLTSPAVSRAADPTSKQDGVELVMPATGALLEGAGTGRLRVKWSRTAYPMAMARDADTGEIMAFVRNSGDVIATGGRRVELVVSDGVRSRQADRP